MPQIRICEGPAKGPCSHWRMVNGLAEMPFNLEKCHVLHVGTANQEENYSLLGSAITSMDQETDLGVVITADLKSSAQCIAAEQKA